MKSSCVTCPPNDSLVIIRDSFVQICDGDVCAAALLNHLVYWHNVKLDQRNQAIAANEIAERHGQQGGYDTSLTQWHTEADLQKAMLGTWGTKKIRDGLRSLQSFGFIDIFRNPNSRFAFDKTKHFIVFPDAIQTALNYLTETEQPTPILPYSTAESADGTEKKPAQLYIETTSKTSSSGSEGDVDDGKIVNSVERVPADPFYTGQARQLAREVVKVQREMSGPRNFITDAPWGELASEVGKDATLVFETFEGFLIDFYGDKKDPTAYAKKICINLWQNPGIEHACKPWKEFSEFFKKNLSAPPPRKKAQPRQPKIIEIPDREASAKAIREARRV